MYYIQGFYYLVWMLVEIIFCGSCLVDNFINELCLGMFEYWVGYCYVWGYVDNYLNNMEYF